MTDATGKSFLSYKRSRAHEAALLIAAQHDLGIPTWQDQENLANAPVVEELKQVLRDKYTASALLWITPEVKDSPVIRKIEVPEILKRAVSGDGFFAIPVCAGGLDFATAADAVDQQLSAETLREWNLSPAKGNPISPAEAADLAARILKTRLQKIDKQLDKALPLKISLHTRKPPAFVPGTALVLDWSTRFERREAKPAVWENILLPSLGKVADAIRISGGGRSVVAGGLPSLPAVTALGAAFLSESKLKIAWSQYTQGREEQLWSLESKSEISGIESMTREKDPSSEDLAVLISIAEDVEPAFSQSAPALPPFRAITKIAHPQRLPFEIDSPGQAVDIALKVKESIRQARRDYRPMETVHLFMAVPAGLAMMIGQSLNTFGAVQTYEHIPEGAVGVYRPAALLRPAV